MKELISNLRKKIISEIKGSVDKNSLEELKIKYLGKKGEFTSVLRNMANVSKEERPKIGELINLTKARNINFSTWFSKWEIMRSISCFHIFSKKFFNKSIKSIN